MKANDGWYHILWWCDTNLKMMSKYNSNIFRKNHEYTNLISTITKS